LDLSDRLPPAREPSWRFFSARSCASVGSNVGGTAIINLFKATVDGWASWAKVFQSIEAFEPLIKAILCQHGLPSAEIERCTPGTNAVFRVGDLVVKRALECRRWEKFPPSMQAERREFLRNYELADPVYAHGDLTPDNVLLDARGRLYIIDFADAVLAPVEYELASIVCQVFSFERPFMEGYFG